jgi:NADH dehydrogenase FAD-containing subunit
VLNKLYFGDYHVTVVAPDTFNTFTPLLPCKSNKKQLNFITFDHCFEAAIVGTVQVRSLVEPLRKIIARLEGHFILGKAADLVMSERLLEVQIKGPDDSDQSIYVPYVRSSCRPRALRLRYIRYDKLIIACGAVSASHGVPGLENCFQLKTISDAHHIRRRIMGATFLVPVLRIFTSV